MNKWWIFGLGLVCFGAGWASNGWRLDAQIADLQAKRSNEISIQADGALKDLKDATAKINAAATSAKSDNTNLSSKLDTIRKDMKNAKALPVDCKPDTVRMRSLAASIDATNQAIAGSVPGK